MPGDSSVGAEFDRAGSLHQAESARRQTFLQIAQPLEAPNTRPITTMPFWRHPDKLPLRHLSCGAPSAPEATLPVSKTGAGIGPSSGNMWVF